MAARTTNREVRRGEETLNEAKRVNPLAGTVLGDTVADDPVAQFFVRHWRAILSVIAAVVLGGLARNVYIDTYYSNLQNAADTFNVVRQGYTTLLGLNEQIRQRESDASTPEQEGEKSIEQLRSDREELVRRLQGNLSELGNYRGPYPVLATLYQGLVLRVAGDTEQAKQTLSSLQWASLGKESSLERLAGELAALNVAKISLDEQGGAESGKALLKDLAQRGRFVHVSAALTLLRVADTPEEEQEAQALADQIQNRNPEQTRLLSGIESEFEL